MLSLAAFRYRDILADAGGPIERLEVAETTVLGERRFLANAYLDARLAGNRGENTLYSRADGSGTAVSPMVAKYMAISEAMERWAHWRLHRNAGGDKYGFQADPSSNGLAAFPGIWRRQARRGALWEAAERFNLLHWWEGHLPAKEMATPWPGVRAGVIQSEVPGLTVILFKRSEEGFFAYGHAAAENFETACGRAAGEMERHVRVISRFFQAHGGNLDSPLPAAAHPIERRTIFFARPDGHGLFLERLRSTVHGQAKPKTIYDGPVPGPWTKYADVWRVVYEPPSRRFVGTDESYFML